MPCELVAELSTNHGGSVSLAVEMIQAAADAGAHTVKIQSYSLDALNPNDPQADWLRQAHLTEYDTAILIGAAEKSGVQFLSTAFTSKDRQMLLSLGQQRFKVASSHARETWWHHDSAVVSFPWGMQPRPLIVPLVAVTAIPLYPTPLDAVARSEILEGWSDHCIGLTACYRALALGVTYLEVHLAGNPDKGGRVCAWDKNTSDLRDLRLAIDDFETIRTGVSRTFRERWANA